MEQDFINWAKHKIEGITEVNKVAYGDQSDVYQISAISGNYYLKIANNLEKEKKHLEWLSGKISSPGVVAFTKIEDKDALLLSSVEGENLASFRNDWPKEKIVIELAKALKKFHLIDTKDCPFIDKNGGNILIHGDACLPNFIFKDGELSGFIDLGDMRVGNPEVDLAASVWSLQRNLGKGLGLQFLKEYGIENATDEMVEKLHLCYENMQEEWGLSK